MNKHQQKLLEQKAEQSLKTERYTDEEKQTIVNAFSDDNQLLFLLRKHFLQGELNEVELSERKRVRENLVLMSVIQKDFVPEIDPNANFNQLKDFYAFVNTDADKFFLAEVGLAELKKWEIIKQYFTQQYENLRDNKNTNEVNLKEMIFDSRKEPDKAMVEIAARNTIIRTIEQQMMVWKTFAVMNLTDPEKIKEKLRMDSNE